LAESWDGSKWTIQSIPAPATEATLPYARLGDVSCASTSECTAVGYFKAADVNPEFPEAPLWQPYVARWKGGSWTNSYPLSPNSNPMEGISCTSASFCAAAAGSLLMTWNGSSWSSQEGGTEVVYRDVSCTSQSFCLAVSPLSTVGTWDGTKWTTAKRAKEESLLTQETILESVTCLSPSDCVASGYSTFPTIPTGGSGTYAATPATEAWNGTEMRPQVAPRETSEFGIYSNLDCSPSHTCVAVGTTVREKEEQLITSIPDRRPTATTEASTGVGASKATLRGSVNPNGVATSYRFEWGTSAAYGNNVPASPKAIGAGTKGVEASESLTGLTPETTYHYRLVAESEGGAARGEDRTFTTPAVAVTEPASSVGLSAAKLNGKVEPSGIATSYQFEYGTTTSYGSKAPASAKSIGSGMGYVSVGQTVEGLKAVTTYHYRVVATNSQGTFYGKDATFTTAAPLHWFPCTEQTGGKYSNSKCTTEGIPNKWESLKLKEGVKTNVTAKGNPIAFTASIGGIGGSFSCATALSAASLENPSGGANGIGNAEIAFSGCKGEGGWSSCKVTPGSAVASKLELATLEGKTYALISPKEGTTFYNVTFAECSVAGTYKLVGTLRGFYSNSASQIEFNAESTAEALRVGSPVGPKVTAVGSIGLETSAGGYIRGQ
jgi:hypothetical protein